MVIELAECVENNCGLHVFLKSVVIYCVAKKYGNSLLQAIQEVF